MRRPCELSRLIGAISASKKDDHRSRSRRWASAHSVDGSVPEAALTASPPASQSGPLRDTAATVECCIGDGSCARDRRPSRPRPGRPPPGRRRPAVLGAGPGTQHRQRGLGVVLLGPRSALARDGAVAQTRPADVITRDLGPGECAGPTGRCGCSATTPPLAARPAHAGRRPPGLTWCVP